jgi:hypothetical protein
MPKTISDAILELARGCGDGEDHRQALGDLLGQAIPATTEQLTSFRQHAPANPEFTPEMIAEFQDGLGEMQSAFQEMQSLLAGAPGTAWMDVAERLEEAMQMVRRTQAAHQERIEDGDTSHLFLNRLLLHLQAWQKGQRPGPMTVALVQAIPNFENDLRSFIEEFDEVEVQAKLGVHLDKLMTTCNEVVAAVSTGKASQDDLATWCSQISQFSQDLDQTLAETVESHLAGGPTPFPIINLVNAAIERYLNHTVSPADLADTMLQCEEWLRTQLPPDSDQALLEAAEEVFRVLQLMRPLAIEEDVDQLLSQREALFAASENLAMFAAVLSTEDGVVNLVSTEGLGGAAASAEQRAMPVLLAQILQQAEGILAGQGTDSLEESVQALERLVTSTQGQMARSRDSKEMRERTQQALSLLQEASGHLWDFVENATDERLDTIEELLVEASEVVNSLSPKRR